MLYAKLRKNAKRLSLLTKNLRACPIISGCHRHVAWASLPTAVHSPPCGEGLGAVDIDAQVLLFLAAVEVAADEFLHQRGIVFGCIGFGLVVGAEHRKLAVDHRGCKDATGFED